MICQKLCAQNDSVLNTIWKKCCWKCQVCCRCDFGPRKKIRIYCLVDSFVLSLKRKSRCFDKFFIICCTCRNGKFRCSKWRNFVIADSVIWHEHQDSSLLEGFRNMCLYTFTLYPRKARHQMALSVSVSWLFGCECYKYRRIESSIQHSKKMSHSTISRDWQLYFYRSEIWQAVRQQRCRNVCRISERLIESECGSRGSRFGKIFREYSEIELGSGRTILKHL